jgi:hypothetical protein
MKHWTAHVAVKLSHSDQVEIHLSLCIRKRNGNAKPFLC